MTEAKLAPNLPGWMAEHANSYLSSGGTDGHMYHVVNSIDLIGVFTCWMLLGCHHEREVFPSTARSPAASRAASSSGLGNQ